jgi:hypothetical protein
VFGSGMEHAFSKLSIDHACTLCAIPLESEGSPHTGAETAITWKSKHRFQTQNVQWHLGLDPLCKACLFIIEAVVEFCRRTDVLKGLNEINISVENGRPKISHWKWTDDIDLDFSAQSTNHSLFEGRLALNAESSGYTGSEMAVQWAKTRLETCDSEHLKCRTTGAHHNPPLRILDLDLLDLENPENSIIELTYGDTSVGMRYVCLSYCWGPPEDQILRLLSRNLRSFENNGIRWSSLPPAHRDVSLFIKRLGYRYMWVDSLCIIQDSFYDKFSEIRDMGSIFAGCDLVVAISHSSTVKTAAFVSSAASDIGYPVPDRLHESEAAADSSDHQKLVIKVRNAAPHYPLFERSGTIKAQRLKHFPLLDRGWTLQEMVLPRRVLQFGSKELLWECLTCADCECGDQSHSSVSAPMSTSSELDTTVHQRTRLSLADSNPSRLSTLEEKMEMWCTLVCEFGSRKLTYGNDRENAITGIAENLLLTIPNGIYAHGHWSCKLHYTLSWFCRNLTSKGAGRKPSWSWASFIPKNGSDIYFPSSWLLQSAMESKHTHIELFPVITERKRISHYELKVKARVFRLDIHHNNQSRRERSKSMFRLKRFNKAHPEPTVWYFSDAPSWVDMVDELWVLELLDGPWRKSGGDEWQWHCLVLQRIGKRGETVRYRRNGHARFVSSSRVDSLCKLLQPQVIKETEMFRIE